MPGYDRSHVFQTDCPMCLVEEEEEEEWGEPVMYVLV